jgi:threonine dehydratase
MTPTLTDDDHTAALPFGLAEVRAAAARIAGHVIVTPAVPAPRLSGPAGCAVVLKLENMQLTGSFKERGAINRLLTLTGAERAGGVATMSAGNHAQAVACHAARLGIAATIVMPRFTPFTKIERTESFGARVVLHGETLADARTFAAGLAERDGLTFVHPYDDPLVAAGQGTAALELLDAVPDLDHLVVPVGGGGLMAGMAVAARALKPGIAITGVQCSQYPSMKQSLAGQPVACAGVTIAEGIAVKVPGALTRRVIARLVDDIVLVDEAALEDAVYRLATQQKVVAEGAGAAALAAVLAHPRRFAGQRVGLVVSGGNIDARLLAQVLMRGLVADSRIVRLRVGLTDAPGALGEVARLLGEGGANIVEIHHQRLFHTVPVKMAEVDVVLETRGPAHVHEIVARLDAAGFPAALMNEVS